MTIKVGDRVRISFFDVVDRLGRALPPFEARGRIIQIENWNSTFATGAYLVDIDDSHAVRAVQERAQFFLEQRVLQNNVARLTILDLIAEAADGV